MNEPEFTAADGTVRKQHYGSGRQPWDDISEIGWGPKFAAGNALKYVRRFREKNGDDDLEKGRWYYARLLEFCDEVRDSPWYLEACIAKVNLHKLLTPEEITLLGG